MKRFCVIIIVTIFLLTGYVGNLFAQNRTCGTTIEQWNQLTQQPRFQQLSQQALKKQQNKVSGVSCDTIKVPVVVHIVYHTAAENVSDEQVQSQIDVLNEDYAAVNATIVDVPDVWRPLVKDSKIRFSLAQQDTGYNTNGIVRTYTDKTSFFTYDPTVKYDTAGGSSAWPASSYLNIWVCNLEGFLGYAAFPGGIPEEDGVVINYKAFGRTGGNLNKKYNLGRTATHEVGHWFKMTHIWGNNDDCSDDDGIDDTPLQADWTFGSPKYPKYDICTPTGDGIMFMNYMDYTDDKAMMFFTPNQIDTMIEYFGIYRDSICFSNGGTLATPFSHDLEIEEILSPVTQTSIRCFQPVVRVRNNSFDAVDRFRIIYNMVDGVKRVYDWTGVLLGYSAVDVTLPSISGVDGLNVLEMRIAEKDSNMVNNYRSRSYHVDKENAAGCDGDCGLVYPDPVTQNSFCIKSGFLTSGNLTIRVINTLGQKIFEQSDLASNPGDIFPVNIGLQPRGVYVVQLILDKESCSSKFINLPGEGSYSAKSICN